MPSTRFFTREWFVCLEIINHNWMALITISWHQRVAKQWRSTPVSSGGDGMTRLCSASVGNPQCCNSAFCSKTIPSDCAAHRVLESCWSSTLQRGTPRALLVMKTPVCSSTILWQEVFPLFSNDELQNIFDHLTSKTGNRCFFKRIQRTKRVMISRGEKEHNLLKSCERVDWSDLDGTTRLFDEGKKSVSKLLGVKCVIQTINWGVDLQVLALCPRFPQWLHFTVLIGAFSAAEGMRLCFRRPLFLVPTGGFKPSSSRRNVSTGLMSPT